MDIFESPYESFGSQLGRKSAIFELPEGHDWGEIVGEVLLGCTRTLGSSHCIDIFCPKGREGFRASKMRCQSEKTDLVDLMMRPDEIHISWMCVSPQIHPEFMQDLMMGRGSYSSSLLSVFFWNMIMLNPKDVTPFQYCRKTKHYLIFVTTSTILLYKCHPCFWSTLQVDKLPK